MRFKSLQRFEIPQGLDTPEISTDFLYSLFSYFKIEDDMNIVMPYFSFNDFLKAVLVPQAVEENIAEQIILRL